MKKMLERKVLGVFACVLCAIFSRFGVFLCLLKLEFFEIMGFQFNCFSEQTLRLEIGNM